MASSVAPSTLEFKGMVILLADERPAAVKPVKATNLRPTARSGFGPDRRCAPFGAWPDRPSGCRDRAATVRVLDGEILDGDGDVTGAETEGPAFACRHLV